MFQAGSFHDNRILKELKMSHNNILSLPESMFHPLQHPTNLWLYIGDNPLTVDRKVSNSFDTVIVTCILTSCEECSSTTIVN